MAYVFETVMAALWWVPPWVGLAVSAAGALGLVWMWYRADRRARQWERAAILAMRFMPRPDTRTRVAFEYHAPKAPAPLWGDPRPWVRPR
jgi:hypothetical protein